MDTDDKLPEMHMLLLGLSHEHILVEIKALGIRNAVLFTSENLLEDAKSFAETLEGCRVKIHEIICVDPFQSDSLDVMIKQIRTVCAKYSERYSVVCGLTGGTNLMAISMSMAALLEGLPCHYSLPRNINPVISVDYFRQNHGKVKKDA